jgi:hypothetical protein
MEETKTIASDELLEEQLSNLDWDIFWLRLMGRCAWVLRKRYSVKWHNDELKDFSRKAISEIINKIFIEKKRKWNIDAYQNFEDFIISALDSHINNTLKKPKNEIEVGENNFLFNNNEKADQSPEEMIIGKELREQIFDELQSLGATDNELLIFECLADGIEKPDDIKTTLNLSDEDFHNSWRRLKRKREVIKQKLAAHGY